MVRHGLSPEGKQRYRCRTCLEGRGRTFLLDYSYAGQSPEVKQGLLVKRGQLTRPSFGVFRMLGVSRIPGPLPIAEVLHCPQAQSVALGMSPSLPHA